MPVSGNEETGVKPISKLASDYIAGVPIKKRRFPKLCLSPPPSEEPTSFAAENNSLKEQSDSLQKEQSDSLQKEQSESLQKEQSDLLQKEQSNSQQKEQPNSQQKEQPNSQQKEQPNSLQKEQSNSLQKEQSNSQQKEQSNSLLKEQSGLLKKEQSGSLHKEQSGSLHKEQSDSLHKEQSDSLHKQQSDSLQSASAATCYSGISDAHKKAVSEEPKESSDHIHVTLFQNVPNYSRVKLKEPRLRIQSGSVGNVDGNDKLVAAKNSELPITLAKTKLKVAPNEALVFTMGKETCSNEKSEGKYLSKKSEGKCKAEIPTIPGNIELTLGLKEHLFPALAGQNGDGMGQKKNSLEPGSLNLSLSNANSSIQRKKDDVESNDDVHLCANRANWDLNVLMDAWQCSASDSAADQVSVDDFNPTDHAQDIKPFICSTGMIGTASSAEHNSVSENRANFDISSKLSGQQNEIVDPVHLGLSPTSFQSQVSQEPSCLSAKEDFVRVFPNMSLPRLEASTSNLDRVNHRTVKSEPFDESIKLDNIGTKGYSMGLLNSRTLKHELVDCSLAKSSNISSLNLGVPESIKTEPVHEDRHALNMIEGTSRVDKQVLQGLSNHSIAMPSPRTAPTACTAVESSCSTELITAGDVAKNFEHSRCTEGAHSNVEVVPQEACESTQLVASETVDTAVGHNGKESNTSVMIDIVRAQDGISDNPEQCRLQCMNDHLPDMRVSEDSVSDEEKIEISADMLEDSYSSDYESDGNHPLDRAMGTKQDGEEDDYEDGEVREPLMDNAVEEPICDNEAEHVDHGDSDNRKMDIIVQDGDYHATLSHGEVKDLTEDPDETNNKDNNHNDDRVEGVSSSSADKLTCLQESLTVEKLTGAGMKRPISDVQGKPGDQSGSKDCLKEQEKESLSEKTSGGNQEAVATVDENVKKILMLEKNDTALPKMEASADGDDVAKDVNNCGIRSRIINLSRASHLLSPGKTSPISARSLPSRAGREMPDAVLEGEDLHPQGRDELYMDGSHKFSRERHQDNSPRNSRLNFMRGRGRITSRLDTLHGDWDSDHDFNSGFYNGTTEFRVPRHKYASAVPDADLEYNSYNIAPEGSFFGTGRGRRKHLNDDIFRRIPSRRQSSGGRDIPAACGGGQMIHRVTRNVSPGRCVDEDGSEMVGPRRSEKFVRVFTDDTMEPMFTRPQPAYEGVGGHFARGTRNFPSVQRRGLPRIHSKSPIRSRSRSPGPWPSRRSQDGFGGPPELIHQRSPPIYRMERMRSPDRPCFTGDLIVRRHGSPPYLSRSSNDLRDMDSGRDNGHPRSVIPNRSQSGRILLRNRQFDAINPREKTGNDEYFGGPMNTGRLHELSGDANGDDRRRYGGRRGPVRSFRPPYNDANGEGFHLNSEDGPRPFRFYPEDDSEFHQRGNLRGRGFDRRIKNQPGNAHRRTRSIEEQEVNYRRGGQVWQDDGFDEISRVKRKRF